MTQGSSKPLDETARLNLVQAISDYKKDRPNQYEVDTRWFTDLMRHHSPTLFDLINYWIPDSDQERQEAFIQGAELPAMIFYRKLGLIGQPQK